MHFFYVDIQKSLTLSHSVYSVVNILMFPLTIWGLGFVIMGCGYSNAPADAGNGLALTPPMGWNSWNTFKDGVSDALLRQVADAMVTNGMRDAGYQYINMDDGWALPQRLNGHLQPDPVKFPYGLKALSGYLHERGFKFGIYTDRGTLTCVGKCPGSYGHETADAKDFADWGVDYLKYDNCNPAFFSTQEGDYRRMRDALAAAGRPIVFSLCAWEFKDWMPGMGQLWRTAGDITDNWARLLEIIDTNEESARFAGPGKWNDPDMLVVGCGDVADLQQGRVFFNDMPELAGNPGLTDVETRSHFSMWAMMAAPLIAGNDVRNMPEKISGILTNREVIAVDQDPLGRQGIEVWENGKGLCVYSKALQGDNARAVALFNRSDRDESIMAKWADIGIPSGPAKVRDLWKHADLGPYTGSYTGYVNPHEVVLLKIVGTTPK
jgi:alpha-galactosidase